LQDLNIYKLLFSEYKEINTFETPTAIDRGLIFVPALSGLACPHWQRDSRACFEGMSLDTGPLDLVQAVLEGVALRIAEVIFAMDKRVSIGEEITIDGGLSKNSYICQFMSEVLGRTIRVTNQPELTAIGCAQLAGAGLDEVLVTEKKGRAYTPKGNLCPDWMEIFSSVVKRQFRPS
jgi:glycerol kinase